MAGPGRPVTGPGRTRGRLPANWAQRITLQQGQTQAEPIKIPKKRGPKPGSKVTVQYKRTPQLSLDNFMSHKQLPADENVKRETSAV